MPELYIITGSNGAGKSSVGPNYLPDYIQQQGPVFDGDKLFMQKKSELWIAGIKAHKEAKRLAAEFVDVTFDALVETALTTQAHFAYEGHFTNEATWDIPRRFKQAGYSIHLIFFGLKDTNISELRVIARAQEGGHYVDPITIADNFNGNLEKLNQHYALFDSVHIVDTSEIDHIVLCTLALGIVTSAVEYNSLPAWFRNQLPAITVMITAF